MNIIKTTGRAALCATAAAALVMAASGSAWAADPTPAATDFDLPSVVLCSGDGAHLVDSVTAGPLASAQLTSVLLTPQDALGDDAKSYLSTDKPQVVYIVGGTAAVADGQVAAITAADPGVKVYRIAGKTRYATAKAVTDLVQDMYAHYDSSSS